MILKKIGEEYKLYSHDSCIATTQESLHKRLSKENCDEIFGVVDVEKLAESHAEECYERNGDPLEESYFENRKYNFKEGFNKAMELNKDKLFTEEDMIKFADDVYKLRKENKIFEGMPKLLQSLQQPKEIEVEVKMEPCYYDQSLGAFSTSYTEDKPKDQPKLDKNGCLILKKK